MVADTFAGNRSFVACLSSAFIPPAMTARTLAEYNKGGAVIVRDEPRQSFGRALPHALHPHGRVTLV